MIVCRDLTWSPCRLLCVPHATHRVTQLHVSGHIHSRCIEHESPPRHGRRQAWSWTQQPRGLALALQGTRLTELLCGCFAASRAAANYCTCSSGDQQRSMLNSFDQESFEQEDVVDASKPASKAATKRAKGEAKRAKAKAAEKEQGKPSTAPSGMFNSADQQDAFEQEGVGDKAVGKAKPKRVKLAESKKAKPTGKLREAQLARAGSSDSFEQEAGAVDTAGATTGVKDVVVHGLGRGEGTLQAEAALRQLFEEHGTIAQVLIRHRASAAEKERIASGETADQHLASLRAVAQQKFDEVDQDGSGQVDRRAMRLVMAGLGMHLNRAYIDEAIEKIGPDTDQKITFEEFFQWYRTQRQSVNASYAVISYKQSEGARACLQAYKAGTFPPALWVEPFDMKKAAGSHGKMVQIAMELQAVQQTFDGKPQGFKPSNIFSILEMDGRVGVLHDNLVPTPLKDFLMLSISPKHPWRMRWDIGVLVVVIWSSLTVPFAAAYMPDGQSGWADVLVDLIFYADICLNFFTGYDEGYQVIMEKKKIVNHYLTGWFMLDLVATVDWELVGSTFRGDSDEQMPMWVKMLAMIKVTRLLRASRLIDKITADWTTHSGLIDAIKFAVYVTVVAHLLACFFSLLPVLVANLPECDENKEMTAMVVACITSMGDPDACGDLNPSDGIGWHHFEQCRQMGWAQQQGNEAICIPKLCAEPEQGKPYEINYDLVGYEDLGNTCYEFSYGFMGVERLKTRIKDADGEWLVPWEMTPEQEADFLLRAWNTSYMQLPLTDPNYQKAPLCMSPWRRYIDALYWSLTTMTTIGYGDRGPKTELELTYTLFAEVFGLAFFALLLAQIDNVARVLSMKAQAIRDDKDGVLQFLKQRQLETTLVSDVVRYMNFRSNSLSGNAYIEDDLRFHHLSETLKRRIREAVYIPRLKRVCFFGLNDTVDPEEQMVESLFKGIDTDGSGFLDRDEILDLFTTLHIDLQGDDFQSCYDELDKEGNGEVSLAEFSWWWFLTKYGVPRISFGIRCPRLCLSSLCHIIEPRAVMPGERIVKQGEYGDNFIILQLGKLRVLRSGPQQWPGAQPGPNGSDPTEPERVTERDVIITPFDREPICGFSACLTKPQFEYVKRRTDM